ESSVSGGSMPPAACQHRVWWRGAQLGAGSVAVIIPSVRPRGGGDRPSPCPPCVLRGGTRGRSRPLCRIGETSDYENSDWLQRSDIRSLDTHAKPKLRRRVR